MTSEILIKLEQDKKLLITDPLQQYAYHGVNVPDNASGQPIRLYHLASHTSGLPREQPGGMAALFLFGQLKITVGHG